MERLGSIVLPAVARQSGWEFFRLSLSRNGPFTLLACRALLDIAEGSSITYDLLLNGEVMGSVVRAGHRSTDTIWTAELLEDLPGSRRPAPFKQVEHNFATLEEVCAWLGDPPVQINLGRSAMAR